MNSRTAKYGHGLVLLVIVSLIAACSDNAREESITNDSRTPPSESVNVPATAPTTESSPTATVESAPAVEPAPTVEPTPAVEPAFAYDFSAVEAIVDQFVADKELNGAGLVIVDREDGIVGEIYAGEFAADRVSLIASSSKMVTAGVLLRLQDQGLLDLNTPIGELVSWAGDHPDITLAQMLSNSSGLVGLRPNPGYRPYRCQFVGTEMGACAAEVLANDSDDADVVPPDTEFRYGGVQWQIAGAVAETVSGKSWTQLVQETYVQPCGVDSLGYNNHWTKLGGGFGYPRDFDPAQLAPTENPQMEGGAYINPVDYAVLLLMHLRAGECANGTVLSPEAVAQAHADRIGDVYGGSADGGTGYGLGWWVDRSTGRISDAGAYGSVPWLDVGNGLGAYLVIESDAGTGNDLAQQLHEPVEEAVLAGRAD